MDWKKTQIWERQWHGTCQNTFWEEQKQQVYFEKMGLQAQMIDGKFPVYDLKGASVLDIGGGPTSILLKCINVKGTIIDPCDFPEWVGDRYKVAGIKFYKVKGEDFVIGNKIPQTYDEVFLYNCLQHCENPQKIIQNARKVSKIIRLFEWIETEPNEGHPHVLTEEKLNKWLGGEGKVEEINDRGCVGKCFYGIFKGNHYEEI